MFPAHHFSILAKLFNHAVHCSHGSAECHGSGATFGKCLSNTRLPRDCNCGWRTQSKLWWRECFTEPSCRGMNLCSMCVSRVSPCAPMHQVCLQGVRLCSCADNGNCTALHKHESCVETGCHAVRFRCINLHAHIPIIGPYYD